MVRADSGRRLGLGTFERHARVAAGVLIFERRVKAADELLKVRLLPRGDGDDRVAARADHVVEPAALYCREAQARELFHRGIEHTTHQPRPLSMSPPEWPPCKPEIVTA